MLYITGNYTASYRDPGRIPKERKDALFPEILAQLKRILHHHSPTKFISHMTAEKRQHSRTYGNNCSASNNIPKLVQQKRSRIFMLARTPQGLIYKEGKSDRLFFDGSFL